MTAPKRCDYCEEALPEGVRSFDHECERDVLRRLLGVERGNVNRFYDENQNLRDELRVEKRATERLFELAKQPPRY